MNCSQKVMTASQALLILICVTHADSSGVSVRPSGYASFECGQIVKGRNNQVPQIDHVWMQKVYAGLGAEAALSQLTKVDVTFEIKMCNEYPRLPGYTQDRRLDFVTYLTQAEFVHSWSAGPDPLLILSAGYFPFKYDADATNLGEYLFRSGTYPQYLITEFDFAFARLLGVRVESTPLRHLHLDGLVYSNLEWVGVHDVNAALIAGYSAGPIEIGAGVTFNSLISVDAAATTPTARTDPNAARTQYLENGDTLNYTFAGQKVMGRASFDIKRLFSSSIFGEKDLKLYAEAAVLGLKDYPRCISMSLDSLIRYDNIKERIPVMVGFNVPCFILLDVLSVECEWFGNRYPNDMRAVEKYGLPIPLLSSPFDSGAYRYDDTKWSVHGTKTIAKNFRLVFQAASDHLRTFAVDLDRQDWQEALRNLKDWYYDVKLAVSF